MLINLKVSRTVACELIIIRIEHRRKLALERLKKY